MKKILLISALLFSFYSSFCQAPPLCTYNARGRVRDNSYDPALLHLDSFLYFGGLLVNDVAANATLANIFTGITSLTNQLPALPYNNKSIKATVATVNGSTISRANYVIGGVTTLSSATTQSGGAGEILGITLNDKDGFLDTINVIIFNSDPAGTYTNGNALAMNSADFSKIIYTGRATPANRVPLGYTDPARSYFIPVTANFSGGNNANLYVLLSSGGGPGTFTANSILIACSVYSN